LNVYSACGQCGDVPSHVRVPTRRGSFAAHRRGSSVERRGSRTRRSAYPRKAQFAAFGVWLRDHGWPRTGGLREPKENPLTMLGATACHACCASPQSWPHELEPIYDPAATRSPTKYHAKHTGHTHTPVAGGSFCGTCHATAVAGGSFAEPATPQQSRAAPFAGPATPHRAASHRERRTCRGTGSPSVLIARIPLARMRGTDHLGAANGFIRAKMAWPRSVCCTAPATWRGTRYHK